jgi:hypothetical protein
VTDLKTRLGALLATPEGKAIIEEGQRFSVEELQEALQAPVMEHQAKCYASGDLD